MSRILHRIFFNFDDGPDPFLPYLETWKRELPDFEIKLWDKTNLPLDLNEYTKTLSAEKNHAFLSDYFRCWLLDRYGGIYLDADIEILDGNGLRSIYDETQISPAIDLFIGVESFANGQLTAHSMGVKAGKSHPILRFMMNLYETSLSGPLHYAIRKFDMPYLMSLYFLDKERREGFTDSVEGRFRGLKEKIVTDRMLILPPEYFSPVTSRDGTMTVTSFGKDTCLCHHFAATWNEGANGVRQAKTLTEALIEGDYAASGELLRRITDRYPKLRFNPKKPTWKFKEGEIKRLEKVLNALVPYGSPLYRLLKGKRRAKGN